MPYIEAKLSVKLDESQKDELQKKLASAVSSAFSKPKSYIMTNIEDSKSLFMGEAKVEKGAYIEVKILGNVDGGASDKMTSRLCEILQNELGIPGNAVYVSYWGTPNWGWNGGNF